MKYVLSGALALSVCIAMPLMASDSRMNPEEIFVGKGSFVPSSDSYNYVRPGKALTASEERKRIEDIFFEELSSEKKTTYVPPEYSKSAPYVAPMLSEDEIRRGKIIELSSILAELQQRNDPEHFNPNQDLYEFFESLTQEKQNLVDLDDEAFNAVIEKLRVLLNQEYSYGSNTADTDDSVGRQVSEDTSPKPLKIIILKSFIVDKLKRIFHRK